MIADEKPIAACEPTSTCGAASGSTLWWISVVAFQTRNRPPAIRMRSRHEKPWPNASKSGVVRRTMIAIVPRSASRRMSARAMPMRRARLRCCSGSLFVRIEMKMRLSIPSTTSIATRVASAAQAAGWDMRARS
jgi:hypothetical protein